MRRLFPLIFLLLSVVPAAAALKPATSEEFIEIQNQLNAARKIRDERDSMIKDRDDGKSTALYTREMRNRDIAAKNIELGKAYDIAIHLAIAAYGIEPTRADGKLDMPSGTVVAPGKFAGTNRTWIPIAGGWDAIDKKRVPYTAVTKNGGQTQVVPPGSGQSADTERDGVTVVFLDTLKNIGPAQLASTLYHESIHFHQMTTPTKTDANGAEVKGGDEMSWAEREQDAYKQESTNIDVFFPYTPKDPKDSNDPKVAWQTFLDDEVKQRNADVDKETNTWKGRLARLTESAEDHAGYGQHDLDENQIAELQTAFQAAENEVAAQKAAELARKNAKPSTGDVDDAYRSITPQPAPTLDTSDVGAALHAAQQDSQTDKDTLVRDYQQMSDLARYACQDPQNSSYTDDLCQYSSEAGAIAQKYKGSRAAPPARLEDDDQNTDCAREFLHQLLTDSPESDCNAYRAQWIRDWARYLHQKYSPAPPQSSPQLQPAPRPRPNPQPKGDGNSVGCPPGTHGTPPNCARAADPL
jgi:hypothetical protein